MRDVVKEIIRVLDLRFTSGNEVPVTRASIRRDEWAILRKALECPSR